MIRVENVTHHYGIRPVLKNISLEIKTGEVVVVVGPNGMGKTTLLGVLAGVLWPLVGTVEFDGIRRRETSDGESTLRRKTVYLPDQPWLAITYSYPLAAGIVVWLALALPPRRSDWQLTGRHRIAYRLRAAYYQKSAASRMIPRTN